MNKLEQLKQFSKEKRLPYYLHWLITEKCNLRCKHCYMPKTIKYVSFKDAKFIVEFLKKIGILEVTLSGGECLLNPDFEKIYLLLKKNGMLVTIYSNGTNFSDDVKILLSKYKPYKVEISVYGVDEMSFHESTRSANNYKKFIDGLHFLKSNDIRTTLKCPITKLNLPYIDQIKKLAHSYDFNWKIGTYVFKSNLTNEEPEKYRLPPSDIVDIEFDDSESKNKFCQKLEHINEKEIPFADKCSACQNTFVLNADNSFSFCGMLEETKFFFNDSASLEKAYKKVLEFRKQMNDLYKKSECHSCQYRNICSGCPAHNKLETGSYYRCNSYYRALIEQKLKLINEK